MAAETLTPTSIMASDNVAGIVNSIQDDPASPDALWISGLDQEADTSIMVAMSNPSDDLEGTQTVRVLVRKFSSGGGDPTCTVTRYANGVFAETLFTLDVTSTTGQVLTGTFDGALVTDLANIELQIVGNRNGGNKNNRRSVEFGAVRVDANVVEPTGGAVPLAPASLTVTPQQEALFLDWPITGDGGDSAITDFVVEYSVVGSGSWQSFADGVSTVTETTITGLTGGTNYSTRVAAVNANGQGPWSNTASGTPTGTPPTGPTVEIWDGTQLVAGTIQIWDGTQLVAGTPSI